jgi:hypothetical protein
MLNGIGHTGLWKKRIDEIVASYTLGTLAAEPKILDFFKKTKTVPS